jgi:hypothetical protein
MRDKVKYNPVNWIDGMKINKDHFIAQENALRAALHDAASINLSPLRYGVLPPLAGENDTFNVKLSLDNQNALRVSTIWCRAVTMGGIYIDISPATIIQTDDGQKTSPTLLQFIPVKDELSYWVLLTVNPFERVPAGNPDPFEMPPRFPDAVAGYRVMVISNNQYKQYINHPYALVIGKLIQKGNAIEVEKDFIPPAYTVSAHPDLVSLHGEIDRFLSSMERRCLQISQKIHKKNQQNDLSQLVSFLCDRILLTIGPALTDLRWMNMYEPPVKLFIPVLSLARVIKNTIDLYQGSGKEELMNYLSEWCDLNPGDMENMLNNISALQYDHNNVNHLVQKISEFITTMSKLFETLSNLEFIGKRKDTGIFIKEEQREVREITQELRPKRKFFS